MSSYACIYEDDILISSLCSASPVFKKMEDLGMKVRKGSCYGAQNDRLVVACVSGWIVKSLMDNDIEVDSNIYKCAYHPGDASFVPSCYASYIISSLNKSGRFSSDNGSANHCSYGAAGDFLNMSVSCSYRAILKALKSK